METEEDFHRLTAVLDEISTVKGIKINKGKPEIMLLGREQLEVNIWMGDEILKPTERFKYLGICFGSENDMTIELMS